RDRHHRRRPGDRSRRRAAPCGPRPHEGPLPRPGARRAGRGGRRVKVLSYNVKGLQVDRDAVVEVIRAAAPDVLLLQEAPRGPWGPRRTRQLARDAGLVAVVAGLRGRGAAIAVRPALLPHVAQARGVAIESRLARFRRGWPT